jgi:hypothetical protein
LAADTFCSLTIAATSSRFRFAQREPNLFMLWSHGIRPATGQ